jgi:uracil-DNA glycosylase
MEPFLTAHATASQHPAHVLFAGLQSVMPYPSGVAPVPEQIQGTSFFPGGTGLWHGETGETGEFPAFPTGGVMVLGHDFHSVQGYEWSRAKQAENLRTPTWRHLLHLLSRVPVRLEQCFFTNIYMGLREGRATTGPFPGAASPGFVKRCEDFFLRQVEVQRPALVLVLGAQVPPFLARLAPKLERWAFFKTFPARDASDSSLIEGVTFGAMVYPCVVASLVHPSFRPSNIRHRRWRTFAGDAAELALVSEALHRAGVRSARADAVLTQGTHLD